MKISKIEDGLLEYDDFLLTSSAGDFLGVNTYSRTHDKFTLLSGYLERNFLHTEYMLVIEKEPTILDVDGEFAFYTRKDSRRSGIVESYNGGSAGAAYWKMVKYNGFIQAYVSDNGIDWIDYGGGQAKEETDIQGFSIKGNKPLEIKSYKLYRSPYIRIYEVEKDIKVVLEDANGSVIAEKYSDGVMTEFFLQHTFTGKLKFYSSNGTLIHQTQDTLFSFGDSYMSLKYDIDLYYKSTLLTHVPTSLDTLYEVVQIKNNSTTDTYNDILVAVINDNRDIITVSLDNVNYNINQTIQTLSPQEIKDIYIKIEKDRTSSNFGVRGFMLELD